MIARSTELARELAAVESHTTGKLPWKKLAKKGLAAKKKVVTAAAAAARAAA